MIVGLGRVVAKTRRVGEMHQYFNRIDLLGDEAEDIAAELPLEMDAEEIRADLEVSEKVEHYMQLLEWIEALTQETVRGKETAFESFPELS